MRITKLLAGTALMLIAQAGAAQTTPSTDQTAADQATTQASTDTAATADGDNADALDRLGSRPTARRR